jgi:hypothetical protein
MSCPNCHADVPLFPVPWRRAPLCGPCGDRGPRRNVFTADDAARGRAPLPGFADRPISAAVASRALVNSRDMRAMRRRIGLPEIVE